MFPDALNHPRSLGQTVIGWGIFYPVLMLVWMQFTVSILAVHYYTLPLVFLGHFMFVLAGAAVMWGRRTAGRLLMAVGAILAIAAAVAGLSIIHMIGTGGGEPLNDATRVVLYLVHGVYLAVSAYLTVAVFRRPFSDAQPTA